MSQSSISYSHSQIVINDASVSDLADMPVVVLRLTDFTHGWTILNGTRLTEDQIKVHADEIWAAIQKAELANQGFTYSYAEAAARRQSTASIYSLRHEVTVSASSVQTHLQQFLTHPNHDPVSIDYEFVSNDNTSTDTTRKPTAVLPGSRNEGIDVGRLFKATSAFILCADFNADVYWSVLTGIPIKLIKKDVPDDGYHNAFKYRHEIEHARLIYADNPIVDFYSEMACDRAAHAFLAAQSVGQATRDGHNHARNLNMLNGDAKYWFQPALDSGMDFFQCHDAVIEIRCRLAMHDLGIPQSKYTSAQFQAAMRLWKERPAGQDQTMPSPEECGDLTGEAIGAFVNVFKAIDDMTELLPNLQRLMNERVFASGSDCEFLASRILDSGEFFSPGICGIRSLVIEMGVGDPYPLVSENTPPKTPEGDTTHDQPRPAVENPTAPRKLER